MKCVASTRAKSFLAKAVSLLTLPALLVAPACTSLCAAQTCAQTGYSSATEGHCHAATSRPHEPQRIHAVKKCNSPEMPPATLTSGNKNEVLRAWRSTLPAASGSSHSQEWPRNSSIKMRTSCPSTLPLAQSQLFPTASILRI
jgi:hypothetical protein